MARGLGNERQLGYTRIQSQDENAELNNERFTFCERSRKE